MKNWMTVAVLAALTGCASITGSKMQTVSVETRGEAGAQAGATCTLANDAGKWFLTSPGSVVVHKSTGDLSIDCIVKNGFSGSAVAVSRANLAIWGNLVFGGIPGYVIDRYSGAGFNYPVLVTVPMQRTGPGGVVSSGYVPRSTMAPSGR